MRINTHNNFDLVLKKYKSWKLMKLKVIMRMVSTPNKQQSVTTLMADHECVHM